MKTILWSISHRYGALRGAGKRLAALLVVLFTMLAPVSVAAQGAAQGLRLTALGDSLTQGYGLMTGEGLVPQLEGWLRARGHDVTVLNAGVSGDTTSGGLARLDWTLADRPDAVIVALGGNDLLRGIDPALSRANLDAILSRLRAEGLPVLLVGLSAPGNYGPEYQEAFSGIYPELAEAYGALLLPDLLAPLSQAMLAGTPPGAVMQGDMIHPNPAGVVRVVEGLGPRVEDLIARVSR